MELFELLQMEQRQPLYRRKLSWETPVPVPLSECLLVSVTALGFPKVQIDITHKFCFHLRYPLPWQNHDNVNQRTIRSLSHYLWYQTSWGNLSQEARPSCWKTSFLDCLFLWQTPSNSKNEKNFCARLWDLQRPQVYFVFIHLILQYFGQYFVRWDL